MDYEKEDLDHSLIPIYCPACDQSSTAFACELEKNPQVICPHCNCIHTVDVEKRKDVLDNVWQMVKNFKNGSS